MKKVLSTVLAIGIIGANLITPFMNVEAASVSKAESLVATAEQHAGGLKWQISYELTKEIKQPDMKVFNLTKNAYLAAKQELSKVSANDKVKLEKRLEDNVGIHYSRAMGYIDALTSGNKIVDKTTQYNKLFAESPTSDATEKSYHELSSEIRKQAILLYRVYGKSTRDAILAKYKTPGEKALNATKEVITAKMSLDTLDRLIKETADQKTVEAQVAKFSDSLELIQDEEIYFELYDAYQTSIRKDANFLSQEKEIAEFFKKADEIANEKDVEKVLSLYDSAYPGYADLKEAMESTFKDFDVVYETTDLEVQYIVDGVAIVIQDQKSTIDKKDVVENTFVYLLKKDEAGNWKYQDIMEAE
ncbi:hypothetical protein [Psychrobacillus sp.]|uniref:hypothetical protein n=1 Tax=Psychrobacillus sp. TaxID=1871623 RepID=UPI0028BD7E57|nr:hypothetical protein [Psychrobacillus sp.]